jgi:hypothetical protein
MTWNNPLIKNPFTSPFSGLFGNPLNLFKNPLDDINIFNLPAHSTNPSENTPISMDRLMELIESLTGTSDFSKGQSSNSGNQSLANVAKSQIGTNEADKSYLKYTGGKVVNWCGAFVNWCLEKTNSFFKGGAENMDCDTLYKNTLKKDPAALVYSKSKGLTNTEKIKKGALIFFSSKHTDKNLTHVGIVDKIVDGKVYTIEGNTSNKVAQRSYAINNPYIQTIINT